DLLLGERVAEWLIGRIDANPHSRLAQQVSYAGGRIAAAAIDQPFVADRLVALDQPPEKALQGWVGLHDRIEIGRLADEHLALDDRLDAVSCGALAGEDAFTGEAKGDDLPSAAVVGLEFRQ